MKPNPFKSAQFPLVLRFKKNQNRMGEEWREREGGERKSDRRVDMRRGSERGRGETNELRAALIPRKLYCDKSEDSVSRDRDDNSAHCEGRQERFGEHFLL